MTKRRRSLKRSFGKESENMSKFAENSLGIILIFFLLKNGYKYFKLPFIKQFSNLTDFDDNYNCGDVLGEGVFGEVFKATDKTTKDEIIAKRVSTTNFYHYFLLSSEIRILEKLRKEGCIYTTCYKKYFFGKDSIIMIFDSNSDTNLFTFINKFSLPIPPSFPLQLFTKIPEIPEIDKNDIIFNGLINGLCFIHNLGIAHNDIKPENIIINSETFEVKYIDFGISCDNGLLDFYICDLQKAGTPYYASPEMRSRTIASPKFSKSFGMKSDVWSLGIVLYSVIYGIEKDRGKDLVTKFEPKFAKYNGVIEKMLVIDSSERISMKNLKTHWERFSFTVSKKIKV